MLTPADIHNKEFSRGFRGYNEEEVDDFLDEIVSAMEDLIKQNTRLAEDLELERKKTAQYQEMEKNLHETMDVAQKTAEEAVQSAKIRVEEMERAAKEDCDRLRHQTEMAIQRRMEDATSKVRVQQELYEAGIARERQFIVRLRSLLRSELAILNADGLKEIIGSTGEASPLQNMSSQSSGTDMAEASLGGDFHSDSGNPV
ncbi:MAG: DivIVA domain-containing protein [Schwartzia sp.]|nr:DivIVA domain-containing protein [Schwartzia sp. (in: firmicutes)]